MKLIESFLPARCFNFALAVFVALLAGCAMRPAPLVTAEAQAALPADCMVTQRGLLAVLGRQFALNGYTAQNAAGARRLVVTEMFGHVLADVLVKPDGSAVVMRSSKALKPRWISRYVVSDMQCVFGGQTHGDCPVQKLGGNHFVVARRWYKLDLQIVQINAGAQPASLFEDSGKSQE